MVPEQFSPRCYDDLLLIAAPIKDAQDQLTKNPAIPWIWSQVGPKVMARPERIGTLAIGGHDVTAGDATPLRRFRPSDLMIAHLPLSTRLRFERRVRNIRRTFDVHNDFLTNDSAWHWRRFMSLADRGQLDQEFDQTVFDKAKIADFRARGTIRSAHDMFQDRTGSSFEGGPWRGDSELMRFKEALAKSGWLLFELMKFKRALVARFGTVDGFEVYQQAFADARLADSGPKPVKNGDFIRQRPIMSLRQVAMRHADFFLEIEPADERFVIAPPPVIGKSNSQPVDGVARSIFVTCLRDAKVTGKSAFVELDEGLALDFQNSELLRLDDQLDFDPLIFHVEGESAWVVSASDETNEIELDTAFNLVGPHAHDFGHWIWEYLPRYIAASLSGALPLMPILIDEAMPPSHRQALELMLPAGTEIVTLPQATKARVRRLWCASGQSYIPILEKRNERFKPSHLASPPKRLARIFREMAGRTAPRHSAAVGFERVFLARRGWRRRKMLNHLAIEAIATASGFDVVYPEDLSFAEQVALIQRARFLLGPDGSAFYLACWSRPGT